MFRALVLTATAALAVGTAFAQTAPRTAPKPTAGTPTDCTNPTPARDNRNAATRAAVLDDKDMGDPAFQAIEADRRDDAARRAAAQGCAQPDEPEEEDDGRA